MILRKLALCILATMAAAAAPAWGEHDNVQFGTNIHVTPGEEIHDAVCFFCSVRVDGKVTGDIVVFFGNVHLYGDAQHDVVNFFGEVTAENNASIENDLVSFFGGVRLGENVSVGRNLVSMFGSLQESDSVRVGNDRVVQPGWVLWGPLLFLCLMVYLGVHEYRSYRQRLIVRGYPFRPKQ